MFLFLKQSKMDINTNHTRNILLFLLFFLLLASRFIHLDWGFPFPMHPDERNMVIAITQFTCPALDSTDCLNPRFFAYGQFPLYVGFIIAPFLSLIYKASSFEHAALALRIFSATASVITVIFLIKTVKRLIHLSSNWIYISLLFFTFVPAFIQFAHFGTTESVLMLCYTMLLYFAVSLLTKTYSVSQFIKYSAVIFGIALGTKVSALAFGGVPAIALLFYTISEKKWSIWFRMLFEGATFLLLAGAFFVITSPYNIINFNEFMGSMTYESAVGLGEYKAFYTRSFEYSTPMIFHFISIFPYSLGWPIFILFVLGLFFLPYKNATYLFLRIQFLLFFIPNSFFYAKWTRFSSPIFPLMVLIAFLTLFYCYKLFAKKFPFTVSRVITIGLMLIAIIPGIAYTSIYAYQDVRFKASEWIYNNMENGSYILSETANVIDVPITDPKAPENKNASKQFTYISFNFYELHVNPGMVQELEDHINQADYIFIPSRRVFANHTCYVPYDGTFVKQEQLLHYESDRCKKLEKEYSQINRYYDRLFSGEMGFQQVVEFTSYPRIELFGITLLSLPDEQSEETWTVFDHPVIRIFKKVN